MWEKEKEVVEKTKMKKEEGDEEEKNNNTDDNEIRDLSIDDGNGNENVISKCNGKSFAICSNLFTL